MRPLFTQARKTSSMNTLQQLTEPFIMDQSQCPAFRSCLNNAEACWDAFSDTACCWQVVWMLLGTGVMFFFYGDFCLVRRGMFERIWNALRGIPPDEGRKLSITAADAAGRDTDSTPAFLLTKRSLENFCKKHG